MLNYGMTPAWSFELHFRFQKKECLSCLPLCGSRLAIKLEAENGAMQMVVQVRLINVEECRGVRESEEEEGDEGEAPVVHLESDAAELQGKKQCNRKGTDPRA